ncbi:hypothetical protein CC117_03425 [Parafrankia colletiae]|uniref:ABC transmembrane type-1 domain-containing protein n=1 Tax=Parafrankia colletiae TaxID=573497 RepID=A0A1S1QZV0_9ACTN|nr:hypothetical protein [Parafrankia colletiae]OHV38991.1 hypothetical protein CC117_03425 [Parafrankia colletiae]
MPYFLARLAVLVILTVVLVVVNVPLLLALLIGFAAAGLATWPIGRMQRRAAARSRAAGSRVAGSQAADAQRKAPGP